MGRRRKANIEKTSGFRGDDIESLNKLFDIICDVEHRKHSTPFIFYLKGIIYSFDYISELFKVANDDDIVLRGWVGQWRTDIFQFKVGDLKKYRENRCNL